MAYLNFFRPEMLFLLCMSHIAAPSAKEITNQIANGVLFATPAPISFTRPKFTRASIAIVVNAAGLIEEVLANIPCYDHDPSR